jgi:Raf kinase inhibitor-like YbhB/YbcL family protein
LTKHVVKLIGRLLHNVRAGERKLAWYHSSIASAPVSIVVSSPSFSSRSPIPVRFAGLGVGDNVSPPLHWSGVPQEAAELAIIFEDPDAPLPRPFVHALVTGIPSSFSGLAEGALSELPSASVAVGYNSFRRVGYAGPRALPAHGPHNYVFQVLALRRQLAFDRPPNRKQLLAGLAGNVIARGRLDGTFERR